MGWDLVRAIPVVGVQAVIGTFRSERSYLSYAGIRFTYIRGVNRGNARQNCSFHTIKFTIHRKMGFANESLSLAPRVDRNRLDAM